MYFELSSFFPAVFYRLVKYFSHQTKFFLLKQNCTRMRKQRKMLLVLPACTAEMAFFLTPYYFSGFLTSFGGLSSLKEALKAAHKAITVATCLQTPKEKRQEKPFVLTIALSGQDSGRAIPTCRRRWTRQWPWRCFTLAFGKALWIFKPRF